MAVEGLQLTAAPTAEVEMVIRRAPADVFQAVVDPAITTTFWYTKSSGPMRAGARLRWEWETYGVETDVEVLHVVADRLVRFTWNGYDRDRPSTVEIRFAPFGEHATRVEITESGFTGDADTMVQRALASTGGFTFVICALKTLLEFGIAVPIIADAHPAEPGA